MKKNECCPFCLSVLPGGGLTDFEMAARLYSLSIEYAQRAMGGNGQSGNGFLSTLHVERETP